MIVIVATHTGWSLEYIGKLPYRRLVYLVAEIDYQNRCKAYRIEYRIGQVMCILASDKTHKYKPEQFIGDAPKQTEVMISMMEEAKGANVVLGDGKTHLLPMVDANIMEAVEEEFDKEWEGLLKGLRAKTLKAIIFYMLKRESPNITRDEVGALLTVKAIENINKVLSKLV